MDHFLSKILEELKKAVVVIGKPSMKRPVNLFDLEDSAEIQFNGYSNPHLFKEYLLSKVSELRTKLDDDANTRTFDDPKGLDLTLELLLYEVEAFKRDYFPGKKNKHRLDRIVLQRTQLVDDVNLESVKARVRIFLCVQLEIVLHIRHLIKNRKMLLNKRKKRSKPPKVMPGQLSLQPQFDGLGLKWQASSADLIEMVTALYALGVVSYTNGRMPTKKAFIAHITTYLNHPIKNPDSVSSGIWRRKKDLAAFIKLMEKALNDIAGRMNR